MTTFPDAIKEAYDTTMAQQAGYPLLAKLLFQAGVKEYVVDVKSATTTYYGAGSHTHHGEHTRDIAASFDEEKVIAALRKTQAGRSTYPEFLDEIAAAGVQAYLADLAHKRVVYIGHGKRYEEAIPAA